MLLTHQSPSLDDEISTTSTTRLVGVHDLTVRRCLDRACLDLGLNLFQLVLLFDQRVLVRFELGLRRFDIGVELHQHLRLGQLIENLQSPLSRLEIALRVFDRELLGFNLQRLESAFGGEPLRTFERQFCFSKRLLSHSDLADDGLALGQERPLEILLASDHRFVDGRFTADHGRLRAADDDPLILCFLLKSRGIQLAKLIPLFHQSPLRDHAQDRRPATTATFDFALHFIVAAALDLTLLQHNVIEWPLGYHVKQRFRSRSSRPGTPPRTPPPVPSTHRSREPQKGQNASLSRTATPHSGKS